MSMRQTVLLSCVAVAASQFNWGQYVPAGVDTQRTHFRHNIPANARHYVPPSNASNWHQAVPVTNVSTERDSWRQYGREEGNASEHFDWHHYANMQNTSGGQEFDWRQYAQNTSGGVQEPTWQQLTPGNFSGEASDATTEEELNVWRERARMRINSFTPKDYQNASLARVDAEYQQNLNRINAPPAVATEAPAVAAVARTEVGAVAPEAPAVTTATRTTTWWIFAVSAAEVAPAASPVRQASPTLLMFALLAGVAMSAVAVGRRHRRNGASSEPLLPAEYTVVP